MPRPARAHAAAAATAAQQQTTQVKKARFDDVRSIDVLRELPKALRRRESPGAATPGAPTYWAPRPASDGVLPPAPGGAAAKLTADGFLAQLQRMLKPGDLLVMGAPPGGRQHPPAGCQGRIFFPCDDAASAVLISDGRVRAPRRDGNAVFRKRCGAGGCWLGCRPRPGCGCCFSLLAVAHLFSCSVAGCAFHSGSPSRPDPPYAPRAQMRLPAGVTYMTQALWGSIGYATPAAFGAAAAAEDSPGGPVKRVVLVTGEGSLQARAPALSLALPGEPPPTAAQSRVWTCPEPGTHHSPTHPLICAQQYTTTAGCPGARQRPPRRHRAHLLRAQQRRVPHRAGALQRGRVQRQARTGGRCSSGRDLLTSLCLIRDC